MYLSNITKHPISNTQQKSEILSWIEKLFFLSWILIPCLYSEVTYTPTLGKNLGVGILFFCAGGLFLARGNLGRWKFPSLWVNVSLALFLGVNFLSLWVRSTFYHGGSYFFELTAVIFLFFAYAFLSKSFSRTVFLRFHLVGLLSVLLIGTVQILFHLSPWTGNKPISTFGNPNAFGAYLVAMLPLLLLELREDRKVWKALGVLALLLFVVNVSFIRSWAVILSLAGAGFFLVFLFSGLSRRRVGIWLGYGACLMILFSIPFTRTSFIKQISEDVRPMIWKGAAGMIRSSPVLGWGAGQFMIFYPPYRPPEYFAYPESVDSTDHAHCELLELCAETGLMGVLSFFFFVFAWLRFVFRRVRFLPKNDRTIVYAVLLGVLNLWIENLLDVNLRFMSSAYLFWSLLGWGYGFVSPGITLDEKKVILKPFLRILGAALLVFFFHFGFIKPFLSDCYFKRAVFEKGEGRFEQALLFYEKALEVYPQHLEAQYRMAYLYGFLKRNEEARNAYEKVLRMAPFFASLHGNLGVVDARLNRLEEARRHLQIQVKMNPYDPERLCELASVLLRMGKVSEGKILLRRALTFNPQHVFALKVLKEFKNSDSVVMAPE